MREVDFGPAKCRGCGLILDGKSYCLGGPAYHPITKKRCPVNQYGGFVCSPQCDRRSSQDLENCMPGNFYGGNTLSCFAEESLRRNWREE